MCSTRRAPARCQLQERTGHADVATTMKYLHYVERPDEATLEAEAFALPSPSPAVAAAA